MAKYTNAQVASFSDVNTELQKVEDAIDDAVDREGTVPNQMEADFDLNSNDIINASRINADALVLAGQPLTAGTGLVRTAVIPAVTVAGMTLDDTLVIGDVVLVEEYSSGLGGGGIWDVVNASSVTENTADIVAGVVDTAISFVLRHDETLRASQFGVTGTGDTAIVQRMFDRGEELIVAGGDVTIEFDSVTELTSTVTLQVNSQKIPHIKQTGQILYNGVNDRAAIVIGEDGEKVRTAHIELAIINSNQSDWTDDNCAGIVLINCTACFIDIPYAKGFTNGLVTRGSNTGFVHNIVKLGEIRNNKRGHRLETSGTGWINENFWMGGTYTVDTGVNSTKERIGTSISSATANEADNNVWIKPSWELNDADAPGLAVASDWIKTINNHVINCRSEGNSLIARFDTNSNENLIEVGFAPVNSLDVEDNGGAGNIVIEARHRHERHTDLVFTAQDMLRDSLDAGGGQISFPGTLEVRDIADGTVKNSVTGVLNTKDVTLSHTARITGALIDTNVSKRFTIAGGFIGANGARVGVICFSDQGTTTISGAAPLHVKGTVNRTFTSSGQGYTTGSDQQNPTSLVVDDDTKSVFIGYFRGTAASYDINSISISAQQEVTGLQRPSVLSMIPQGATVKSDGDVGGAASAGAGNQFIEMTVGGTTYKVLHDGTV